MTSNQVDIYFNGDIAKLKKDAENKTIAPESIGMENLSTNPQNPPAQDFNPYNALEFSSQGKADELNGMLDSLKNSDIINDRGYGWSPQADSYSTTQYRKFRNTGVDYFDSKDKLTLMDAWLAKKMGLDVKYHYQKIDLNANVDFRNKNQGKRIDDFNNSVKQTQNLYSMLVPLMVNKDTKENIKTAISKGVYKAVGGAIDMDVTDPEMRKNMLVSVMSGIMASASGVGNRATDEHRRLAAEYVKGAFDSKNYYDLARVAGEVALNGIEQAYTAAQMSGFDNNTLSRMYADLVNARNVVKSIKESNREDFAKNPTKTFAVLEVFLRGNLFSLDRLSKNKS